MKDCQNIIRHTRGDTLLRNVGIYQKSSDGKTLEPYTPQEGDTLRFALKHEAMTSGRKQYVDAEPLIFKDIPMDTLLLELTPEDTKPLDFGNYVYDIELTYADGRVETIIKSTPFILTPEVE